MVRLVFRISVTGSWGAAGVLPRTGRFVDKLRSSVDSVIKCPGNLLPEIGEWMVAIRAA